jgi:hypothetical protein
MVQIFHKDTGQPDQAFWSNSRNLVAKQQKLFEELWEVAMPLSARTKELEYQQVPDFRNTLTNYHDIKSEITNMMQHCRDEMLGFSNQLDKFNEFILIEDSKLMLRSNGNSSAEMEGHLSTEESAILVQEIVFEKYWNEIISLKVINNN